MLGPEWSKLGRQQDVRGVGRPKRHGHGPIQIPPYESEASTPESTQLKEQGSSMKSVSLERLELTRHEKKQGRVYEHTNSKHMVGCNKSNVYAMQINKGVKSG